MTTGNFRRLGLVLGVIGFFILTPLARAYVLGPTNPGKWGPSNYGTGATVTWSLMADGIALDSGVSTALASFMPVGFEAELQRAFDAWSTATSGALVFAEIADAGEAFGAAGASGDIRLAGHAFDGANGTLAHGYYPPVNGGTTAGDIHFDTAEAWKIGFGGGGFDLFQVAAHEIGHALGLAHTGVANSLMNAFYSEAFSGPQADDIAGMVAIYVTGVIAVPEATTAHVAILISMTLVFYGVRGVRSRRENA